MQAWRRLRPNGLPGSSFPIQSRRPMSSRWPVWATVALAALAGACRNGQSAAPAPGAMPPTTVALAAAQVAPIEETTGYVATVRSLKSTAVPAADRRSDHADPRQVRRSHRGGLAGCPESIRGGRKRPCRDSRPELAAREAAVTLRASSQRRATELHTAGAISKQEQEQAADRPAAPPRPTSRRCRRRCSSRSCQLKLLHRDRAHGRHRR